MVTIASIAGYNYIKITKMRKDARTKVVASKGEDGDEERREGEEIEPMLGEDDNDDEGRRISGSMERSGPGEGRSSLASSTSDNEARMPRENMEINHR